MHESMGTRITLLELLMSLSTLMDPTAVCSYTQAGIKFNRLTISVRGVTVSMVTTAVVMNSGTFLSFGFGTTWELALIFNLLC